MRARAPPCALPPFTVTAPCLQAPRRPRASCWVGQGEGDAHRLVLWRVRCVRLRLWRVEWARAVRAVLCMRRGACSGEQGGACVVLVLVLCVRFSVCGVCVRGGAQWARGAALSSSSSSPPPSAACAVAFWTDRPRFCLPRWTRILTVGSFTVGTVAPRSEEIGGLP